MKEVAATLHDIARVCERLALPSAVIGGIAVGAYGIPRPTYDIDFTVAVSRERLAEVYSAIEDEGYTIPEDLILLKLLASRPRDLLDVQDVLFIQGQLDEDYMHNWAAELGVEDKLRDALSQSDQLHSGDQP